MIAVLASYAALDLAGRVTSAHERLAFLVQRRCYGNGIRHLVDALHRHVAFRLPVPVQYDWPTFALAAGSNCSFCHGAVRCKPEQMGVIQASLGSVLMGGGIAAMHYIGMAAMRLSAMCHYSSALHTFDRSRNCNFFRGFVADLLFSDSEEGLERRKAVSALVMGVAIPVMHYTGMAAATFTFSTSSHQHLSHAINVSSLSVVGIGIAP